MMACEKQQITGISLLLSSVSHLFFLVTLKKIIMEIKSAYYSH